VTHALLQLLDNSVHCSRDGLSGKVHAEAVREGPMLRITLRDEGRGFTPGQEAYALRRFAEPGKVSGGGIGLAIVRVVAERSGGSVEAAQSQNPKGAIITLRLPESR
jgi:signal transduction histidine kinase